MRAIKLLKKAIPTLEGAGVHLNRVFGYHDRPLFDPFLMLDDFRNDDPAKYLKGFPWHPHRGIETITYMLEGSADHGDSLGNSGTIHRGEVQWMTAGSGIIHQEMPKPDAKGRMYGFQLWTNLPAAHKLTAPRYRDLRADQMPVVELPSGAGVKVICGEFRGIAGPAADIIIQPQYWDVFLPAGQRIELPAPPSHTCFVYAYGGEAACDGQTIGKRTVALFEDGDGIMLEALGHDFRCLYLCGRPLNEPIAWRGPIVMNTPDEIRLAFRELEDGTFIRN
jgi:redox-sensitive bicupin YhaK (pirin superfamily)